MLGNFIIGLREGLEAALVVSILVTYLVRTDRKPLIRFVSYGVGSAIVASVIVAIALQSISSDLSEQIEPIFAGIVSFLAVGFVTWMIFWMKRTARTISGDLRKKLDSAALGGAFSVSAMAFIAVAREGTETAIFFWAAAHATGQELASLVGLALGLGLATLLGIAFYKSTVKINLPAFFKSTGILLTFVSAGVLTYAIHEFQEVSLLPGDSNVWINLSSVLTEGSLLSSVTAGLFNISATTTGLEVIAWVIYVGIVLPLFLRKPKISVSSVSQATSHPEEVSASSSR